MVQELNLWQQKKKIILYAECILFKIGRCLNEYFNIYALYWSFHAYFKQNVDDIEFAILSRYKFEIKRTFNQHE